MSQKVVHIVLNPFTQDSRVIRECKSLTKKGYDVTVIAYWLEGLSVEERENGYKIIRIPLLTKSWSKHPIIQIIKYLEFLIKSLLITKKIKPDICHGHDPDGLLIGYFVKFFLRSKLIYDSHELWSDSIHLKGDKQILYKIGRKIEKILIKYAEVVIAVNKSILDVIKKENNIKCTAVVRNIPHAIECVTQFTKKELGFPDCESNIIYVGNIERGRGIEVMIKSMERVHNNIGLVLMGKDSAFKIEMEKLSKSKKLESRIRFIDSVHPNQILSVCKLADVGIAPIENLCKSYYLSLPNKIFEYIHAELPVLVSDFPEMKNIVENYSVGEVFNVDEPSSIIEVINNYFDNPDQIIKYEQNCLQASKELNWDNEEKQLFNLYKKL